MSFLSFAITIRPLQGVTDDDVSIFNLWVSKHAEYYYIVTEKEDEERHIHAGVFLKKKKSHSNMNLDMVRLFKRLSPDEKSVLRKGVKIMYNRDFLDNYMTKGDSTVIISRNLPEESFLEGFDWPVLKKKGPSAADPYFAKLEELWYEHKSPIWEVNPANCRHFLADLMYNKRILKCITDNRKVYQTSCTLSRYINKESEWHVDPDPFHQDA